MVEFEAILFDMDGVLVDSIKAWFLAFKDTSERFVGRRLTLEEFEEKYWGIEVSKNIYDLGMGDDAVDYCRSRYIDHIDEIKVFSGVEEILSSLDGKVGLVTSTPSDQTFELLNHFELIDHFDVIITGDDVESPKPEPEPVKKACRILDVLPRETVFVGDTESDVEAGRKAGCTVIGVGVDGDLRIEKFSELRDILEI